MYAKKTSSLANGTTVKAWGCIFSKISVDFLLSRLSCLGWRHSQVEGWEEEGGERKGLMLPYRTLLLATGSLSTSAIHSTSFSARMWEQSDCQAIMNKMKRLSLYKSALPSYFREPKGSGPSQLGLHTCNNLGSTFPN